MFRKNVLLVVFLILLLAVASGCKKRQPVPVPASRSGTEAPPVIQLSANPAIIAYGQSTTLTWSTTGATSVRIENTGTFPANGSTVLKPEASTTYTAVAEGPGGQRTAQVRVTVTGQAPPSGAPRPQPEPPARPPVEERNLTTEEVFSTQIGDVFFDFDKYDLTPEAQTALSNNARVLSEKIPGASILIEGHCDERGTEEYNLALGDKRANAARDFLIARGISASRIRTISYGEERPLDPGHDEDAWSRNRRAHFVLVK